MGLLLPTNGKVYIDYKEVKLNSQFWRDKIALVPQDLVMFNDTIKKNIVFNSNKKIDENYIYELLKKVGLERVIENLPNGIETKSGENGISLSLGERQRLGICRALYRKPEILILDESTSSLDNQTENKILNEITRLKGNISIIMISHKLNSLKICDNVYYLENGKIKDMDILNNLEEKYPELHGVKNNN